MDEYKEGDWFVDSGDSGRVWVYKNDRWTKTGIILTGPGPRNYTVKEGLAEVKQHNLKYTNLKPFPPTNPVPDDGEIGFGPYEP